MWIVRVRLLPVMLALLAIALSSLHAGDVHAATDRPHFVHVKHSDDNPVPGDVPAATSGTHCAGSLTCHSQAFLAASPDDLAERNSSELTWPESLSLRDGRTLTVPVPPPLAVRA